MELARVFTLSLYALTAFAAWMLGRAEGGGGGQGAWIPYATFAVLVLSYAMIERRAGRSLSPGWANLLGALAVAAAGWEFSQPGEESKLLAGAHLLVYATWIVMFQEKTYRLYWWVMALGVLQVAVASVLQPGPWYGFGLMIYVCGALATMSIAGLYQVQQQFAQGESTWKLSSIEGPQHPAAAQIRSAVRFDETHGWLTRRFLGGVAVLISLSVLVSTAFFALTPRVWFGPRNLFSDEGITAPSRRNSVTGFSREVRLGEMGEILESVEPVFSVRCREALTRELIPLDQFAQRMGMDEPLFRGAVMTEYERGRWYPERNSQPVKVGRIFNRAGYEQEISLEPTVDETLFCMGSPEAVEIDGPKEDAYLELATGILTRERRPESEQRLTYAIYTRPLTDEQIKLGILATPRGMLWQSVDPVYLRRNSYIDARRLSVVVELARSQLASVREQLGRDPQPLEVCRAFERYFRDSGEFGYTLDLSVVDPSIDPVEDFLINRREGHCEYFASSLTLMLRAVGIPTRMVSGFKGAEWNSIRGSWEVQERFAHAWVEAWSTEHEAWITLDPTPGGARNESLQSVSQKLGFWGRLRASSSNVWQDYVVNVNLRQQQTTLYAPIKEFFDKLVSVVKRTTGSRETLWLNLWHFITHPSEWLSITGGIVTFLLLASVFAVSRGVAWLLSLARRKGWLRSSSRRGAIRVVAFYQRFLKAIRRLNLNRAPAQTPQEFAQLVAARLREHATAHNLGGLPLLISSAFYRVRYGGAELSDAELQQIETELTQLELALRQ